jgi:protein-tyrosine-phosphatase
MSDKKTVSSFFSNLIYDDANATEADTSESNPTEAPQAQSTARTVTPTSTTTTTTTVAPTATTTTSVATVNEEMHQGLLKLVEDNNLEGFDYIEFMDSVAKMSAVALPEQDKYKLVFTTAQSFGVTREKLIEAVDHYMGILEGHKAEFEEHAASQVSEEVVNRKNKIETLETQNEELNQKIADISQQIASNTTEIASLTQEAAQEELKINMVAQDFNVTYEHVTSRMQSDKQKLSTYLV